MSQDEIPAAAQPGTSSPPGPGRQPGPAGQSRPEGQHGTVPQSASALLGMLGGKSGMLDSSIPGAIFVAVYVSTRQLAPPLWIAAAAAGVILAYRLIMRDTPRHALGGFFGVAIAAGLALLTGRPENYFVPTLVINAGYAVASAGSLAARWPLVGLVLGAVFGEGTAWRGDTARRRAYTAATALWLGMFVIRIAVLLPLWLAGMLVPLGIGRIVLGYPLYALVVWLTWLIVSRTRPVRPEPAAP